MNAVSDTHVAGERKYFSGCCRQAYRLVGIQINRRGHKVAVNESQQRNVSIIAGTKNVIRGVENAGLITFSIKVVN